MEANQPKTVNRAASMQPAALPLVQQLTAAAAVRTIHVQTSLKVSSPHDPAEKEAETTAKKIMRMAAPESSIVDMRTGSNGVFRQVRSEERGKKLQAKWQSPHIARFVSGGLFAKQDIEKKEEKIQRKAEGQPDAGAYIPADIQNSAGSGSPLPVSMRRFMEPRFQADFSRVKVHTGDKSAKLSRQLNARAFTVGNNIFFGKDRYQLDSYEGRELIAHELTHTIQQGATVQRSSQVTTTTPAQVQRWSFPKLEWPDIPNPIDYLIDKAKGYIGTKAEELYGFPLFTVVIGKNPITGAKVDRSPGNILKAAIRMIPGGDNITQALENHKVFEKISAFAATQFQALKNLGSNIWQDIKQLLTGLFKEGSLDLGMAYDKAKKFITSCIDQVTTFAIGLKKGIVELIKDLILKPIAAYAKNNTNAYPLLCAVMGEDPITKESVPQDAETLIGGFMKLIKQEETWANMQKAKAVPRAFAWFKKAVGTVKNFVKEIPGLFIAAFKSLEIVDIILIPRAFIKLAKVFGSFAGRFIGWGLQAVWDLLEIIFDSVKPGLMGYIKKTGAALKSILKNPLPFVGNLVKAARLGFTNFADRFKAHLMAGLIDWLTGSLEGVYIPKALTLPELGKLALSVLGITWAQIRGKIVKVLGPNGETIMKGLETGFDIVMKLITGGPAAAWELIKEKLTDLKDTVVSGIISFVTDTIIKKAIPKLISMFIPGAGFISAIISIYDTIMVFVQKIAKIIQVVTAFIDSIVTIAAGNISAAAKRVESILGGLLSLAISFLAGFLGLGKVTDKVMGVIQKVRTTVDKAIDAAIAWIVGKAKALFGKLFGKDKKDERTDEDKRRDKLAAIAEAEKIAPTKGFDEKAVQAKLGTIKSRYKLLTLNLIIDSKKDSKEIIHFTASASEEMKGQSREVEIDEGTVDALTIWEASALGTPAHLQSEAKPVTKLNPANVPYAKNQIVTIFSSNNVPASDADAALAIIDQLLSQALEETTARAIENRLRSVTGIANKALKAGGTGTTVIAHHSPRVEKHPGTFPETRRERMYIPAEIKKQIDAWLAQHPGMKKDSNDYQFIVSTIRTQLFETRHPNLETPLNYVDIIISSARSHRKLHSDTD